MTRDVRSQVEQLTPAGKLVFKILEYNDGMTQKQLVEASRLSARTVRNVLDDLEDLGAVTEEVYLPDARQDLYRLTDGTATEGVTVSDDRSTGVGISTDD